MKNKLFLMTAIAAGLSLAACGGGGSHHGSNNEEPQYDTGYRIVSVEESYQFNAVPDIDRLEAAANSLSAKITGRQETGRVNIEIPEEAYERLLAVLRQSAAVFAVGMSLNVEKIINGNTVDAYNEENLQVSVTLHGMELPYFQYGPAVIVGLSEENLKTLQKIGIVADICLYDEDMNPLYDLYGKKACANKKFDIPVNKDSFAKISTGDFRTCGVTRSGDVYCWGQNFIYDADRPDGGLLGLGDDYQETNYGSPMKVAMPEGTRIIDITTGVPDTYAISSLYEFFGWGHYSDPVKKQDRESNVPSIIGSAVAIDAGYDYPAVYFVTADSDRSSQYCQGGHCNDTDGEQVTQVSAGDHYRCSVDAESRLACHGKLDEPYGEMDRPSRTGDMGLASVSKVSVGESFACAISNLSLYCWGFNLPRVEQRFANWQYYDGKIGLLGTGNTTDEYIHNPALVSSLSAVTDVAVGAVHACAISGGEVYCWGAAEDCTEDSGSENRLGVSQIGLGPDVKWTSTPTKVKGLKNIVSVNANRYRTCAVDRDGRAWCFGANMFGELGNGQINDGGSTTPVEVQLN